MVRRVGPKSWINWLISSRWIAGFVVRIVCTPVHVCLSVVVESETRDSAYAQRMKGLKDERFEEMGVGENAHLYRSLQQIRLKVTGPTGNDIRSHSLKMMEILADVNPNMVSDFFLVSMQNFEANST